MTPTDTPERPGEAASLAVWRKYAATVDPERAEHIATMTKKALLMQYGGHTPAAEPTPAPRPELEVAVDPEVVDAGTAWARVMRDVAAIGKDSRNEDQHFNFRGIDATMNTTGPSFRRHGVFVLPVGVEVLESERYESKRGAAMHGMVTRHEWLMMGPDGAVLTYPDGSPVIMRTLGQAADTSDKVATKASSVAYRTLLLQALTVPTGDRDPDADTPERASGQAAGPVDPRQEQWDRIAGLARYARQSPEAIRKHYLEKMGHAIDGPEATVAALTEYGDRLEASFRKQAEAENAQADRPGAERDADGGDPPPATPPADDEKAPPAAATQPEPTPEPPAAPPAAPEPQRPAQGRDPRQSLWDDILTSAARLKMTADATRADFKAWAADADGGGPDIEIDGPKATHDLLTRYAHTLKGR